MKRDMDLIRALLLEIEGEEKPDLSCWSQEQKLYHTALLIEAELIHGEITETEDGSIANTLSGRLTWNGHEFLDAAKDDTVWKTVKERLAAVGANVAWPVLNAILTDLAKKKLGLP